MGQGYLRISPAPPPPADNDGDKTDDGKEKEHPIYVAHYVAAMDRSTAKGMKVSPFMRPRHVLDANSLETALKGCDVYARTKVIRGPQALG
jgi:ATP-dependent helicase IRC3